MDFVRPRPNPNASLRMICFPYAGAGPAVFHSWPENLPEHVEVVGVQLPGHGARIKEAPRTNLQELVNEILPAIQPLTNIPFILYGHSFGGLLAYETAKAFERQGITPKLLAVSGCRAPHLPKNAPDIHSLPDREFAQQLERLGGIPTEVMEHAELMQLMLPILRADFQAYEAYTYPDSEALKCSVIAAGGDRDPLAPPEELDAWEQHTTGKFQVKIFPGDHFFINPSQSEFLQFLVEGFS